MNKVSAENLIEINQIIKNILYNDSEIDFELMKNYTNEIYCILNNIVKLGYLKWNYVAESDTVEYAYEWPKFLQSDFKANLFYIFPKDYEFQFDRITNGEEFVGILVEGMKFFL